MRGSLSEPATRDRQQLGRNFSRMRRATRALRSASGIDAPRGHGARASEFGGVMSGEDLARVIAERALYLRRDGGNARAHQLRARGCSAPNLFEASDDGSGRIALVRSRTGLGGRTRCVLRRCWLCCDGEVRLGRSEGDAPVDEVHDQSKPSHLVEAVSVACRRTSRRTRIRMPAVVPVPREEMNLGRARAGEGNRSWSAGAGTGPWLPDLFKPLGCSTGFVTGIPMRPFEPVGPRLRPLDAVCSSGKHSSRRPPRGFHTSLTPKLLSPRSRPSYRIRDERQPSPRSDRFA